MNTFCNKCGKKLEQNDEFCQFCGAKAEQSKIINGKRKAISFLKKYLVSVVLIICVYIFWYVIIDEFIPGARVDEPIPALAFTILTIYAWNKIIE